MNYLTDDGIVTHGVQARLGASADSLAAFVVNGRRVPDLARLRQRCEQQATACGWRPPLMLVTTADDAGDHAARRAIELGAVLVCAVGGDGTVRACAQALAGTGVRMAIVPTGSANLTAHALRIPQRLDASLTVAFHGQDRRIDLAEANGVTFAAMAGIGLDAAVVGATHDPVKRVAGWPAYAVAAAGKLLWQPVRFTVRLDGAETLIRRARSVAVGNCGLLPGGFRIMPDARLDDGKLDVAILAPSGPLGWASIGYRVVVRSRIDDRQLERHRASTVEIRTDTEAPRQIDGEAIEAGTTLNVCVLPGALVVRVPANFATSS
jgi:diacylglycerol kinase family enzyme